jgi:hypothetical protein
MEVGGRCGGGRRCELDLEKCLKICLKPALRYASNVSEANCRPGKPTGAV